MKKVNLIKNISVFMIAGLITLTGCFDSINDEDFSGHLSGKIVDNNGNFISGDIKDPRFAVHAQGEHDQVSMVMRINGDGTYANSKLFTQVYKVWLEGPIIGAPTDAFFVDLTERKVVVEDFVVTPFLTIPEPVVSGTPTSTEIIVDYNIIGNGGYTPELREIYCSTVSWPTRTTGTGDLGGGYFTKNVSVTDNQGSAIIDGLQPNTKYFIRIGARATGQTIFNHSDQITVTTPPI